MALNNLGAKETSSETRCDNNPTLGQVRRSRSTQRRQVGNSLDSPKPAQGTVRHFKGRTSDRNLAATVSGRPFTPAVILFIALPEADDKTDPG